MIRFLGVMIGSAATLGGMLLLLGKPEFSTEQQVDGGMIVRDERDAVAASAIEKNVSVEKKSVESEEPATTRPSPPSVADGQPLLPANTPSARAPATSVTSASNPDGPAGPPFDSPPANDSTVPLGAEQNWHSFWNPFRSEIAANGFATRLTRVTGIDYRVLRLQPGSYQVAFAYADDDERRTKIAQIEQATGLELPEESM